MNKTICVCDLHTAVKSPNYPWSLNIRADTYTTVTLPKSPKQHPPANNTCLFAQRLSPRVQLLVFKRWSPYCHFDVTFQVLFFSCLFVSCGITGLFTIVCVLRLVVHDSDLLYCCFVRIITYYGWIILIIRIQMLFFYNFVHSGTFQNDTYWTKIL